MFPDAEQRTTTMTTITPRRHGKADDLNPADYELLGFYYHGDHPAWIKAYASEDARLSATLASRDLDLPAVTTKCTHCGARFAHGAAFFFAPTGEVIVVGQICAGNTFSHVDRHALAQHRLHQAFIAEKEKAEAQARAAEWKADPANQAVFEHLVAYADGNGFYTDLLSKLERYGYLTYGQTAAVVRNFEKDRKRAEMAANRAAEDAQRAADGITVPEGRQTVIGVVVSVKWQENAYGGRRVMTVKDDRNFLVWGSVPRSIDPEVGDRVGFIADLTVSDRDPGFGFFKRPTKATVI